MQSEIRRATQEDSPGIAAVKVAVWPDENSQSSDMAQVLALPDHITHAARNDKTVVGFVDGFWTRSYTGALRWEVDLLAVHPAFQGQGIATALVAASTSAGEQAGVDFARALIKVENIASQRTFARCDYALEPGTCGLYVSSPGGISDARPSPGLHLVPVTTLGYRGIWLEGELSPGDFVFARHVTTQRKIGVVGAVIPLSEPELIRAAGQAGYHLIGNYQWWTRYFTSRGS